MVIMKQSALAVDLCPLLPSNLQHILALANKKGDSSWLSALSVQEHVLLCIRLSSGIFCVYVMVSFLLIYLLSVCVARALLWTML